MKTCTFRRVFRRIKLELKKGLRNVFDVSVDQIGVPTVSDALL